MDRIFKRLIDSDLADLSGLTVDATIPVTESLANEFIAMSLQENPQLEYCQVHIHGENRITCHVKSSRWPWPFNVRLKLFSSVDITHSPAIRAFMQNYALLGKLGSLFNALPDGVNVYEDQVSINIQSLMTSQEERKLLGLIKAMEIRTEEGRIFFDIKASK